MEALAIHVALSLVQRVFTITFKYLHRRMVDAIDVGDLSLEKLRMLLSTEGMRTHNKLDRILQKSIDSASENVIQALIFLKGGNVKESRRYFELAEQDAMEAFSYAPNFESKITATRFRLLCSHNLHGSLSENYNEESLHESLCASFAQLVRSVEVQSAFQDAVKQRGWLRVVCSTLTRSHNRAKRVDIVTSVLNLQKQLQELTSANFEVKLDDDRPFTNLPDFRPCGFGSLVYSSYTCVKATDEFVVTGDDDGIVRVMDSTTMEVVRAAKCGLRIIDIALTGNQLFVLSITTLNVVEVRVYSSADLKPGDMLLDVIFEGTHPVGMGIVLSEHHLYVYYDGKVKAFATDCLRDVANEALQNMEDVRKVFVTQTMLIVTCGVECELSVCIFSVDGHELLKRYGCIPYYPQFISDFGENCIDVFPFYLMLFEARSAGGNNGVQDPLYILSQSDNRYYQAIENKVVVKNVDKKIVLNYNVSHKPITAMALFENKLYTVGKNIQVSIV